MNLTFFHAFFLAAMFQPPTPSIDGAKSVEPHKLCKLVAKGIEPTDAILWRVTPRASIDKASTSAKFLQFTARPGTYHVDLLVIRKTENSFQVLEDSATIIFKGIKKSEEPKDPPIKSNKPRAALGKIQFGSSFCTATVIGPQRSDGKWYVLTAAHCVGRVGQRGTFTTSDRRRFSVVAQNISRDPDCCWCLTEDPIDHLDWAKLAKKNPRKGEKVWHAGFGVNVPGNLERGVVNGPPNRQGKMSFYLSVSSGDSGGGIFLESSGEVVSCVCCTTRLSGYGLMFGCAPEVAQRLKPVERNASSSSVPKPLPLIPHEWADVGIKPFPLPVIME